MVCCSPCFRRGNSSFLSSSVCVAHLLLPPLEHSTASSVAFPHISCIFYATAIHSMCPMFAVLHFITKHLFSFFLFVCLFICLFFHTSITCLHLSLLHDLPPADCHLLSPASRHVVSSISRAYSSLWTLFPLKQVIEHVFVCVCLCALMCF